VQHRGPYRRQAHPRPPLTPYTHTRTIMLAVHGGANELSRIFGLRGGPGVAGVLRLLVMRGGDLAVLVTVLGLLSVPIGQLLLSGAVTGVVVGIAAQQSLGHAFAGLVLLMARPFTVGDCITLRSGGIGGQYDGEVTAIGLIYTTLRTGEGPMSFPNSTVLAAATGRRSPEHTSPPGAVESAGAGACHAGVRWWRCRPATGARALPSPRRCLPGVVAGRRSG